jgi:hypothetical protein
MESDQTTTQASPGGTAQAGSSSWRRFGLGDARRTADRDATCLSCRVSDVCFCKSRTILQGSDTFVPLARHQMESVSAPSMNNAQARSDLDGDFAVIDEQ